MDDQTPEQKQKVIDDFMNQLRTKVEKDEEGFKQRHTEIINGARELVQDTSVQHLIEVSMRMRDMNDEQLRDAGRTFRQLESERAGATTTTG